MQVPPVSPARLRPLATCATHVEHSKLGPLATARPRMWHASTGATPKQSWQSPDGGRTVLERENLSRWKRITVGMLVPPYIFSILRSASSLRVK